MVKTPPDSSISFANSNIDATEIATTAQNAHPTSLSALSTLQTRTRPQLLKDLRGLSYYRAATASGRRWILGLH